jgi:hypothetical protein
LHFISIEHVEATDMRSRNWQPNTSLTDVLRRVITREKAVSRRKRANSRGKSLETLESRLLMSAVHTAVPTIPSLVTATATSASSAQVHWTDKDTSTTG